MKSNREHSAGSGRARESDDAAGAPDGLMRTVHITRITSGKRESCEDVLVREAHFELSLNGGHLVGLACLPTGLEALTVGFLASEGILRPPYAVEILVDREGGRIDARGSFVSDAVAGFFSKRTLTSGCGGGLTGRDPADPGLCLKVDGDLRVARETISSFMQVLRNEASLYSLTGGAHIAALADGEGTLLLAAQDIGRHTAVDKVIGKAILTGIDLQRSVLYCSGRLSSEITAKAIHARTPVLVSRAAPTDLSVRLARRFLLTLVGFARGSRMNIYSVPERIVG